MNSTERTKAQNLGSNAHGKDRVVFKKATDSGMSVSDISCIIFTVKCLTPDIQFHIYSAVWGTVTGHTKIDVTVTPAIW